MIGGGHRTDLRAQISTTWVKNKKLQKQGLGCELAAALTEAYKNRLSGKLT